MAIWSHIHTSIHTVINQVQEVVTSVVKNVAITSLRIFNEVCSKGIIISILLYYLLYEI